MLLLLFQSAALSNYSLAADSGTLVITGSDATLTYTTIPLDYTANSYWPE